MKQHHVAEERLICSRLRVCDESDDSIQLLRFSVISLLLPSRTICCGGANRHDTVPRTTCRIKLLDHLSTARENAITPAVALLLHPPDGILVRSPI
jgi:hypothetical protein